MQITIMLGWGQWKKTLRTRYFSSYNRQRQNYLWSPPGNTEPTEEFGRF